MQGKQKFNAAAPFPLPLKQGRAQRLQQQAANCIALALEAGSDPFADELLGEAIKLWRRAAAVGAE